LRRRAVRLADRLAAAGVPARAIDSVAAVGGGGAPGVRLASAAVSLPAGWAPALRTGDPPVVGRLEKGRCLLDLRTVAPADDDRLAVAVRAARPDGAVRP
jgi:L-seryl-tRNA(Ser) seleniumtransferase